MKNSQPIAYTQYVELYPRQLKSPTVHKSDKEEQRKSEINILINSGIPSHQFSKLQCNTDVVNRLLFPSDPLLSCNSKNEDKESKTALEWPQEKIPQV